MAELNVLYGCDDNYAPYTGVSITSLLENNQDLDQITIYLAAMDFSEENKQRMQQTVEKYGRKLIYVDTQRAEQQIEKYHCKGWNGSVATWLRFFVLEQLPQNIKRILWLDSDTIVKNSLRELCDFDFCGAPIACACDAICYYERFRLGFGLDAPYFNAGVIYFNLPYWREHNLIDGMFRHLQDNIARYTLNDQDLLNDYFRGQILKLPQRLNCQGTHLAFNPKQYLAVYPWKESAYYSLSEIQQTVSDPSVVHFFRFLGDYPWQNGRNYHPAKKLYENWKLQSLWHDHIGAPERSDVLFRVEKQLYRVLPKGVFLRIFCFVTNRKLPKQPL